MRCLYSGSRLSIKEKKIIKLLERLFSVFVSYVFAQVEVLTTNSARSNAFACMIAGSYAFARMTTGSNAFARMTAGSNAFACMTTGSNVVARITTGSNVFARTTQGHQWRVNMPYSTNHKQARYIFNQ